MAEQFNPYGYYTAEEKRKLQELADAKAAAQLRLDQAKANATAWRNFYNYMSANCFLDTTSFTFTEPAIGPGTGSRQYRCDNREYTVKDNMLTWELRRDSTWLQEFNTALEAYTAYKKQLDDYYLAEYQRKTQQIAADRAQAEADRVESIASTQRAQIWSEWLGKNGVWVAVAIVVLIYLFILYRRNR